MRVLDEAGQMGNCPVWFTDVVFCLVTSFWPRNITFMYFVHVIVVIVCFLYDKCLKVAL